MNRATKLSVLADDFPDAEVEYEDLLSLPYGPDRRAADGAIDCFGIVLDVYRRAGLGLPDPAKAGLAILDFQELFEEVPAIERLYDMADLRTTQHHLMVAVRSGLLLSARLKVGVYTMPTKRLIGRAGVTYWRLRDAALPI